MATYSVFTVTPTRHTLSRLWSALCCLLVSSAVSIANRLALAAKLLLQTKTKELTLQCATRRGFREVCSFITEWLFFIINNFIVMLYISARLRMHACTAHELCPHLFVDNCPWIFGPGEIGPGGRGPKFPVKLVRLRKKWSDHGDQDILL